MANDETTTQQVPPHDGVGEAAIHPLALAVIYASQEPHRMGEIAWLDHSGEIALGRRAPLAFRRHRPGTEEETGPLNDAALSRRQLVFGSPVGRKVPFTNEGRLGIKVNGLPIEQGELRAGDVVELGTRLVLYVHARPRQLSAASVQHRFGEPDAQGLVGESPAAWTLRSRIGFVAERLPHVLVHGVSGTGKELVARSIHALSGRARRPLVSRNAATIPDTLADSELFGNQRNYPNPGMADRPGLVGEAHGGVLFLDEFGELPIEVQAKLLRVLDSGEYTRLGEASPRQADIRLIAATNRELSELKTDLLARVPLRVATPRLADRREDVGLLATHLMRRMVADDPGLAERLFEEGDPAGAPRITGRLMATLTLHPYQTEIRELAMLLWEAMGAAEGAPLDLFEGYHHLVAEPAATQLGPVDPATLNPETVQAALDRHGGSQELAWRELGLSSRYVLARLVRRHGLKVRGRRGARIDEE